MLMAEDEPPNVTPNEQQQPQQPVKYARLKYLLQQTSAYSKFLADKLSKQDLADPQAPPTTTTTTSGKEIFSQPSLMTGATLKPFQLEGVEWLVSLYENGLNGILADEMGLGKTVQCIAFFAFLVERRVSGPFLVVAPLSTLSNWQHEFARFTPTLRTTLYHGPDRRKLQSSINNNATIVITNYETVIKDAAFFRKPTWKYVVIDEGHRIKNINCRLVRELTRLRSLNRLLLTGTPLQNNLAELWSLLHFLLPDIFDDLASFESWFDICDSDFDDADTDAKVQHINNEQQKHIVSALHDILKPFLLRRLKSDVLQNSLPSKREFVIRCPPTALQRQMMAALEAGGGTFRQYIHDHCDNVQSQRLQGATMQSRKICNDPRLFDHRTADISDSAKMMVFDQLIRHIINHSPTDKVLVFSQMSKQLDIISDHLDGLRVRHVRIDGSVNEQDRQSAIAAFTTDPATRVFLLTTRSGGLGLNLCAATIALLYDPDWNPQADRQAADRLHRIGQARRVAVVRLRVAGSVEERRMAVTAGRKERLERRVISKRRFKGRQEYLGFIDDVDGDFDIEDEEAIGFDNDNLPDRPLLTDDELRSIVDHNQTPTYSAMLCPFHRHSVLDATLDTLKHQQ